MNQILGPVSRNLATDSSSTQIDRGDGFRISVVPGRELPVSHSACARNDGITRAVHEFE